MSTTQPTQNERRYVVAEVYPAEVYRWLGITFGAGGKQRAAARQQNAAVLRDAMAALHGNVSQDVDTIIANGFASDDAFDAFVGLLGMLWVLLGKRPLYEPKEAHVKKIEGRIWGQSP